jgi:phosphoribosylformylglycinamidine cyclo-ligase
VIDGTRVKAGDVVIGVGSRGLHSNGYSLARKALRLDEHPELLASRPDGWTRTLGEELLQPTAIYARTIKNLQSRASPKALAHVTGGGIAGNLPRVLPAGVRARLQRSAWPLLPIFPLIQAAGGIDPGDMDLTFNMGLGLIVVVAPSDERAAIDAIEAADERAFRVGEMAGLPDPKADPEVEILP